MQYTTF